MSRPPPAAGVAAGQRHLNGPQTTGRDLSGLSAPRFAMTSEWDVGVRVRDGTTLMADVHRPAADGRFPALLAVSCYPRQIQNSGAPLGFVEAGASDFWVPRGYGHVIANSRGTGGSEGVYSWLDATERQDVADLVEWTAAQPWCDGNVGMIGISYFAMTQLAAAAEAPPSLKALFPVATTADVYDAAWHHGLFSETFVTAWLAGVATLARVKGLRNAVTDALSHLLRSAPVHARFEHLNGEAALSSLATVMRAHFPDEPWGELWRDIAVRHQVRDSWWEERDLLRLLPGCRIPMYLGCDWQNVPLHLPSTFDVLRAVEPTAPVLVGMLGKDGLTWPWESLHVEALAWFDHWLKGIDTGIMSGPRIRYWLPGADEFRSAEAWPPPDTELRPLALAADGVLGGTADGSRAFWHAGTGPQPPKGAPPVPLPTHLTWQTDPLPVDLDMAGDLEVELSATVTAADTSWIVTLQEVAPDGTVADVTAGWLRASLRDVAEADSVPGRPVLPCTTPRAVPPGEPVTYRIPLVANARRFRAGHRVRVVVASDDCGPGLPAILGFRHTSVGTPSVNTVHSRSRLLLPVLRDTP